MSLGKVIKLLTMASKELKKLSVTPLSFTNTEALGKCFEEHWKEIKNTLPKKYQSLFLSLMAAYGSGMALGKALVGLPTRTTRIAEVDEQMQLIAVSLGVPVEFLDSLVEALRKVCPDLIEEKSYVKKDILEQARQICLSRLPRVVYEYVKDVPINWAYWTLDPTVKAEYVNGEILLNANDKVLAEDLYECVFVIAHEYAHAFDDRVQLTGRINQMLDNIREKLYQSLDQFGKEELEHLRVEFYRVMRLIGSLVEDPDIQSYLDIWSEGYFEEQSRVASETVYSKLLRKAEGYVPVLGEAFAEALAHYVVGGDSKNMTELEKSIVGILSRTLSSKNLRKKYLGR